MVQQKYNGLAVDGKYGIGGYVKGGKSEEFVAVDGSTLTMDLQPRKVFLIFFTCRSSSIT
jgi:hypothetical protein